MGLNKLAKTIEIVHHFHWHYELTVIEVKVFEN